MPSFLEAAVRRFVELLDEVSAVAPEPQPAVDGPDDAFTGQGYGEAVDGRFVSGAWRSGGHSPSDPHP